METFNSLNENKLRDERKTFLETIKPEDIADNFPLFIDRQNLARFLVRYELFKKILEVKGSIVECGVYKGAALMFLAKLSAVYEPYAYNREIIGFDTFSGFPSVNEKDGHFAHVNSMSDVNL